MATCSVCIENFNGNRKAISCCYCSYSACTQCVSRYILSTINDPHCMNCKREWQLDFLLNNLPKRFLQKEYKKYRENLLFEREKSYLPQVQHEAGIREKINKFDEEICDIKYRIKKLKFRKEKEALLTKEELSQINKELSELNKLYKLKHNEFNLYNNNLISDTESVKKENKYIKPCPNCKGFLNDNWYCDLCETIVCSKCLIIKKQEHECKEEDIESAKIIKSSCKNCPKCGIPIYRSSGCYQMWCTSCHTPFDWNTGKEILDEKIHNPHYYEWIKKQGYLHEIEQHNNCEIINNRSFLNKIIYITQKLACIEYRDLILYLHRELNHLEHVIEMLRTKIYSLQNNHNLRVKFLINGISEEKFKQKLIKSEKERVIRTTYLQIYEMYVDVCKDLFLRFSKSETKNDIEQIILEFKTLQDYTNDNIRKIKDRFGIHSRYSIANHCIGKSEFVGIEGKKDLD